MASTPRRRLTVGLMITVAVLAFEALAVATIGPRIARDLGGDDLYGWLFAAFMLANLVGIVLAGHVSDRQGPAAVYVVALALFAAGLLMGGLAPGMLVLIAARALQGLGGGALYNAGLRLDRAGVLRDRAAAAVRAALQRVGDPRAPGPGARRCPRADVRLAQRLPRHARARPGGRGARPAPDAGPRPGARRRRDRTDRAGRAPRRRCCAARRRPRRGERLGRRRARGRGRDHRATPVPPAHPARDAAGAARLAGRRSRRWLATVGMALVAAGIGLAAAVAVEDASLGLVVVAWAIGGLGMGLSYSPTSLVALSEADPGRQGAATSAVQLTDVLGAALGTGIAGAIVATAGADGWSRRDALAVVFALMTAVAALGVLVARRFPPDPPEFRRAAPERSGSPQPSPSPRI